MTKRWRIFAVMALSYVLAYFYRVSMAVLAGDLTNDLSLSAIQLGTLSGAFFYAFAFTQIPLGPVLDHFGGKRTVMVTGFATLIGVVVFASSPGYTQALLGRILLGIGSASVLMGSLRVFTNWFDRQEFGRISGFIIAIGNIGNMAGTAPLAWSALYFGWRSTFFAVACLQALVMFMIQYVVVERPAVTSPEISAEPKSSSPLAGIRQVISAPSYRLMSFLAFSWYANYMAIQGLWGGPYLVEAVGLGKEDVGQVLFWASVGFLVGCLFIGTVTDKFFRSTKRTIIVGQLFFILFMTMFLGPAEHIPKVALSPIFFLMGISVSSGVAVYPLIRESFPHSIIGTALTAVNFFILLGAAVMQQVMGIIISRFDKITGGAYPPEAYHAAFLLPITLLAISTIFFTRIVDPRKVNSTGH